MAVFLVAAHGLERAQATEFALDRDTGGVCHVDHLARHLDVVVVTGDGLAVGLQRAIHHDRTEAQVDRAPADIGALAVVLVHDQRNMWMSLNRCGNQMLDERLAGIFAGAGAGLQDHRRANFVGRGHDGLHLLQVVHIEGWNAIAVGGRMVQQFAHRDECHCHNSLGGFGYRTGRLHATGW